jgi:hypothetical protein
MTRPSSTDREKRLAAALRDNLRKRKQGQRNQEAPLNEPGAPYPTGPN